MQRKNIIIRNTILTNLLIGNSILVFAGLFSEENNINFALMIGMSIACTIIYLLVFKTLDFHRYTTLKLGMVSVLCCMIIIMIGNSIALFLQHPSDLMNNLGPALAMGIFGNIILFPVSIVIGIINLFWFNKLKAI